MGLVILHIIGFLRDNQLIGMSPEAVFKYRKLLSWRCGRSVLSWITLIIFVRLQQYRDYLIFVSANWIIIWFCHWKSFLCGKKKHFWDVASLRSVDKKGFGPMMSHIGCARLRLQSKHLPLVCNATVRTRTVVHFTSPNTSSAAGKLKNKNEKKFRKHFFIHNTFLAAELKVPQL